MSQFDLTDLSAVTLSSKFGAGSCFTALKCLKSNVTEETELLKIKLRSRKRVENLPLSNSNIATSNLFTTDKHCPPNNA